MSLWIYSSFKRNQSEKAFSRGLTLCNIHHSRFVMPDDKWSTRMNTTGLIHTVFGYSALGFGGLILLLRKGSGLHRLLGYSYVLSMLALNVTALGIYRVFRTFGPFHVLALVSLASVVAGFLPAYRKKTGLKHIINGCHGRMSVCWQLRARRLVCI